LRQLIERIDMLLYHLDQKSLLKLTEQIVNINLDTKQPASLIKSLSLSLDYQYYFTEKIQARLKDLKERAFLHNKEKIPEDLVDLSCIVNVKIHLLSQLSGLYGESLSQVLPLTDLYSIR